LKNLVIEELKSQIQNLSHSKKQDEIDITENEEIYHNNKLKRLGECFPFFNGESKNPNAQKNL